MKILINKDIYINVIDSHNYALFIKIPRTFGKTTMSNFALEGYFTNTEHALKNAIDIYFYGLHSKEEMDLQTYYEKLTQFRIDFLKDIGNILVEKKLKK